MARGRRCPAGRALSCVTGRTDERRWGKRRSASADLCTALSLRIMLRSHLRADTLCLYFVKSYDRDGVTGGVRPGRQEGSARPSPLYWLPRPAPARCSCAAAPCPSSGQRRRRRRHVLLKALATPARWQSSLASGEGTVRRWSVVLPRMCTAASARAVELTSPFPARMAVAPSRTRRLTHVAPRSARIRGS